MSNLRMVLEFGLRYLRPYWARLSAGILLGFLFGATNASFIWATRTLMERFEPAEQALVEEAAPKTTAPAPAGGLTEWGGKLKSRVETAIDPWLPRVGQPMDGRQMLGALLFLPLLVLVRSSTNYLSNYCIGWVSERVVNDMRLEVLQKLSTLSLDFFNRATTGDLLTRINVDTAKLLRCLKSGAADLVIQSISLIAAFIGLLLIDPRLTLLAVVFVPACMFPLLVLGKKVRRASRAGLTAEILQSNQLVELLSSMRIVKAFGLEREQIERFRLLSRQVVRQGIKGVQAKELVNPIIEVISMIGVGVFIVYIFRTGTSIADFVGFLTGLMFLFYSIKKLAAAHVLFEAASPGVQRLAEILAEQPTVREPAAPRRLPAFRSEISFSHVTFGYAEQPVLRDLSLTVPFGAKMGVAGPSGSGKSTLVNLLFRFYDPVAGHIEIDGIDLREISLSDLRQVMALVSQEVVIFDKTIGENIACGSPGATRAEIETAARDAYAHEFIVQLPAGYETRVGERGVTLSGGQRQRLAIARAFIRNAPILVLDEATASLDSAAEAEVQRAIDHLSENRTVIAVAHRLATLGSCELIIVLEAGQIVEQGSFSELLQQGGAFTKMAQRQGIFTSPKKLMVEG